MKDLLFIYNPYSGKGMIKENLSDIIDIFVKAGYRVSVYPTQSKMDARNQVIHCAMEYDIIVCSGGDGTLNEVVGGVLELPSNALIGYIPAGSTNDFATSIRLPKDMKEAAKIVVNGSPISVDIGMFGKKPFVYIAAFGVLSEVSYATPQELKNTIGHPAYIIEGLKKLAALKNYHMKVTYDDGTVEGDFILGMVSNSVSVGGFKGITGKNVVLDDGLFEVTLVKQPKNPIDFQVIVGALLGMELKAEGLITFKTKKIVFECDTRIPWTIDGEYAGSPKRVCIKNRSKAINIMSGIAKKHS